MKRIIRYSARFGTALLLMVLVWSCATIPGLKEETGGSFIRIPFVRVLLEENQNEVTFSSKSPFAVECLAKGEQTVYYSSRPVNVIKEGDLLKVTDHKGGLIQSRLNEVNLIPRGNNARIALNNQPYRGLMKVLPNGETVRVINVVYMEDYLRGVVPPEIGKRSKDELESVKAQAVAARTYAMAHLRQYEGQPYDVKSSIIDQVYEGLKVEDNLISKAIDATAGSVLFYEDKYVNAYYHSTCGGSTDDVAAVWDRKEIPYLKPVKDDGACSWSKYYSWKEVFSESQLRGRIEQYLSSDRGRDLRINRIQDVQAVERTAGGRVLKLLVRTENDVYRFYKDRIRWVVGRTSNPDLILPSTNFDVKIERDGAGNLVRVTFEGHGYGHGVGMCQCGAIGLSRQGWTYDKILTHYYTGAEVRKLY
ncbi:MAG: SpoIID/LytB domain-containing protein [candidate division Zixibacteria bacterium]|nr:SpoIID/LytB domain-containing protein [candidate division Zixibacteria bacterium]